ncbi:MAG: DUF423 domain-containing protein [Cryomorphaceae bacterium]|nr:DUF423 domain-containing protein [Flavobacteriales bacterium]
MNRKERNYTALAAIFMLLAVGLGALGAHALENVLSPERLDSFTTGVRYQAWHALGLLLVQLLPSVVLSGKTKVTVSRLFAAGIICFSFSIYLLSLRDVFDIGAAAAFLGPVTPIGGLLLMAGWAVTAVGVLLPKKSYPA